MKGYRLPRLLFIAATTSAIAVTSFGTAATAHGDTDVGPEAISLKRCINQAHKLEATAAWVCNGDGLTVTRMSKDGRLTYTFTPVEMGGAPTNFITPQVGSYDEDDSWCESTGVCHQSRLYGSPYLARTKANAYYGLGGQTIGSFDEVIRTNLNGRSARWTVKMFWDQGPWVTFTDLELQCKEDIAFWPDNICGIHDPGFPYFGPSSVSWYSPLIYGNYLANANDYYAIMFGQFEASGYSYIWTTSTLRTSPNFICPTNNADCYYP